MGNLTRGGEDVDDLDIRGPAADQDTSTLYSCGTFSLFVCTS